MLSINFEKLLDTASELAMLFAIKVFGAIFIFIVGSFLINKLIELIGRLMNKKDYDLSLQTFLMSFVKVALKILLLISIAGMIGIDITSFAALLAGAGVAIGAALNGSLGNLAGGVMMLVFKPFKVGDMIEAQNVIGTVKEMGIFATTILTADNKTTYIPNGPLSTGIITNYTRFGNLRVDLMMYIGLDQEIELAKVTAKEALAGHPKVLTSPAPEVCVFKISDSMIHMAIRPYTIQQDYWQVYFGVQELVKKAWDQAGIRPPAAK